MGEGDGNFGKFLQHFRPDTHKKVLLNTNKFSFEPFFWVGGGGREINL